MGLEFGYGVGSLKTGVCTSTTRPASPFDGQVISETDTDSLKVYNGTAWVTPPSGLVCVKAETAFTGASTAVANSIFTSTYSNYRIVIKALASGTTGLRMQLAVSGTAATTNYQYQILYSDSTTVAAVRQTSQASFLFGDCVLASNAFYVVDICSPQLAEPTILNSQAAVWGGVALTYTTAAFHTTATAYDGLVLFPAAGTFTGTYAVYGYSKTV